MRGHAAAAALILGEEDDALVAANGLWIYLQTPAAGVSFDELRPDGTFLDEARASELLLSHICAIAELRRFETTGS